MTLLFIIACIGLGYYLLRRHGKGPDRPTIREDIGSLFRRSPKVPSEKAQQELRAQQDAIRNRDGRTLEADSKLTDGERVEEIMNLQEIWDASKDADNEKRDH